MNPVYRDQIVEKDVKLIFEKVDTEEVLKKLPQQSKKNIYQSMGFVIPGTKKISKMSRKEIDIMINTEISKTPWLVKIDKMLTRASCKRRRRAKARKKRKNK